MSSDAEQDGTGFAPVVFPRVDGTGAITAVDADELERLVQQARARGHAAGYAVGLRAATVTARERLALLEEAHAERAAQAEARLEQVRTAMSQAVAAVRASVLPVLEQSDDVLVAAAIDLAEALVGRELSLAGDGAVAALNRVLGALGPDAGDTGVVVRMHPDDAALLREAGRLPAALSLQADPALARGDAVAELQDGLVDARIGTAIGRARQALLGASS